MILVLFALLVMVLAACTGQDLLGKLDGWSPAAARDGVVYIGTNQGEVKALEDGGSSDARVKWTFCVKPSGDGSKCDEDLHGVYDSPAVGEKLVYVAGTDGYLYAIEKDSGTIDQSGWRRAVGRGQEPDPVVGGPTLVADRNLVLVGSEDGRLYAFDSRPRDAVTQEDPDDAPEDGILDPLRWSSSQVGKIWSTPVVGNNLAYFGSHDNNVYAVNLDDGVEEWRFPTKGTVAGRPLLVQDLVVVGSFDKKLYALDADTGAKRWEFEGNDWFWAGAVSDGETIFAPSMDDHVYALDTDGSLLWKHNLGSSIVSRPVLVPRGLAVATKSGKVHVLDASRKDLGEARELDQLLLGIGQLKAPLFAVDDAVYAGSQDSAVARLDTARMGIVWCVTTDVRLAETTYQQIRCN